MISKIRKVDAHGANADGALRRGPGTGSANVFECQRFLDRQAGGLRVLS